MPFLVWLYRPSLCPNYRTMSFAVQFHLLVSQYFIYHSIVRTLLCISHPFATLIPVGYGDMEVEPEIQSLPYFYPFFLKEILVSRRAYIRGGITLKRITSEGGLCLVEAYILDFTVCNKDDELSDLSNFYRDKHLRFTCCYHKWHEWPILSKILIPTIATCYPLSIISLSRALRRIWFTCGQKMPVETGNV